MKCYPKCVDLRALSSIDVSRIHALFHQCTKIGEKGGGDPGNFGNAKVFAGACSVNMTQSPDTFADTNFPFKIPGMTDAKEHPSTSLFRDYIRINTMQPNPDYPACIKFLRGVADSMGLQCKVWMLFGQNKLAKLCRYNAL